jgi:hypothetical protein
MLKYRAPVLSVTAPIIKPVIATDFEAVMCQVHSLSLPESQDTKMVLAPAVRYFILLVFEIRVGL